MCLHVLRNVWLCPQQHWSISETWNVLEVWGAPASRRLWWECADGNSQHKDSAWQCTGGRTGFVTWQVLIVKRVGKRRRRRENKENCQILRSSSEFTKCKGIQRILSPSCGVSFALLSLVLGDAAQDSTASLPSSTGTLGCGGVCRMYSYLLQGGRRPKGYWTKAEFSWNIPLIGVTLGWALAGDRGVEALCSSTLPWHTPLPELCYLSKLLAEKIDVCKALSLSPSWNSCQRCNPT